MLGAFGGLNSWTSDTFCAFPLDFEWNRDVEGIHIMLQTSGKILDGPALGRTDLGRIHNRLGTITLATHFAL